MYECHLIGPRDVVTDEHLSLRAVQFTALYTSRPLVVPVQPPADVTTSHVSVQACNVSTYNSNWVMSSGAKCKSNLAGLTRGRYSTL